MIRAVLISLTIALAAASPLRAQDTRLIRGGSADAIVAADGFKASVFAQRLGDITAIARHEDGTLFVAERGAGRIFRIQDRGLDGTADTTQALSHRFDRPTGLAFIGNALFVSDKSGLWRISSGGGTPDLIAPFARAGSTGEPHPITPLGPNTLLLGLNRPDGTARLLEIELSSGSARLREEASGEIIGFSTTKPLEGQSPAPWVLFRRDGIVHLGQTLARAQDIGLDVNALWLDELNGRAAVSLPDGLMTSVATFAGIRNSGQTILSGLTGGSKADAQTSAQTDQRQAVQPGAILADARGLFLSDRVGGRIWLISQIPDPVTGPTSEPDPVSSDEDVEATQPQSETQSIELLRGSGIKRASTIGPASKLKPGDQPASDPPPKE